MIRTPTAAYQNEMRTRDFEPLENQQYNRRHRLGCDFPMTSDIYFLQRGRRGWRLLLSCVHYNINVKVNQCIGFTYEKQLQEEILMKSRTGEVE